MLDGQKITKGMGLQPIAGDMPQAAGGNQLFRQRNMSGSNNGAQNFAARQQFASQQPPAQISPTTFSMPQNAGGQPRERPF